MSPSSGEEISEDDDEGSLKNLREQLEISQKELADAKFEIKTLKQELWREKDINNALLSERTLRNRLCASPAQTSQLSTVETQESPALTCAQREQPLSQASPINVRSSAASAPFSINRSVSPLGFNIDNETTESTQPTNGDSDEGFQKVEKRKAQRTAEDTRIHRCKGALYSLKKYMPKTVKTVFLGDSNHRSIYDEHLDGSGTTCKSLAVGGLCIPATIEAMTQANDLCFKHVETFVLALGTNDILHAPTHYDSDHVQNMIELNSAAKKIFPNANITYIPPFAAIEGVGKENVQVLTDAVKQSGVGWPIHPSPGMKGKLAAPQFIHLKVGCRKIYVNWLQKTFKLLQPPTKPQRNEPSKAPATPACQQVSVENKEEVLTDRQYHTPDVTDDDRYDPWVKRTPNTDTAWIGHDPHRIWNFLMSRVQHPPRQPPPPWPYYY